MSSPEDNSVCVRVCVLLWWVAKCEFGLLHLLVCSSTEHVCACVSEYMMLQYQFVFLCEPEGRVCVEAVKVKGLQRMNV